MPIERHQLRGRLGPRRLLGWIERLFKQAKHGVHSKKHAPGAPRPRGMDHFIGGWSHLHRHLGRTKTTSFRRALCCHIPREVSEAKPSLALTTVPTTGVVPDRPAGETRAVSLARTLYDRDRVLARYGFAQFSDRRSHPAWSRSHACWMVAASKLRHG